MKSVIACFLIALVVSPLAQAACTYDVAPIQTFFDALAIKEEYVGPLSTRERNSAGGYTTTNLNGSWVIKKVGPSSWEFLGEFCTSSICQSMFDSYRIEDGCLKSGDATLNVMEATPLVLEYHREVADRGRLIKRFVRTTDPETLRIFDDWFEGKRLMQSSRFNGR